MQFAANGLGHAFTQSAGRSPGADIAEDRYTYVATYLIYSIKSETQADVPMKRWVGQVPWEHKRMSTLHMSRSQHAV